MAIEALKSGLANDRATNKIFSLSIPSSETTKLTPQNNAKTPKLIAATANECRDDLADLSSEINKLQRQFEGLESQLNVAISNVQAGRRNSRENPPRAAPDIEQHALDIIKKLNQKLSQINDLATKLDRLISRCSGDDKLNDRQRAKLEELKRKLDEMKDKAQIYGQKPRRSNPNTKQLPSQFTPRNNYIDNPKKKPEISPPAAWPWLLILEGLLLAAPS